MNTPTRDLQNQAKTLMAQGDWPAALDILKEACRQDAGNAWALGQLAYCHSQLKQHKEAIALYERLCQLEPTIARWPYMLGYQYYDQKLWPTAIECFDRALKINPDYIVVLYRKGYALSQVEGKHGEALSVLEQCRRAYQALPEGEAKERERKSYAGACFQQGKIFLDANRLSLAEERLREAAALKPDDSDIYYNLGKTYLAISRWDDALNNLASAQSIAERPQHYVLDAIAQAHSGAGQLVQAISVYEQMPPALRNRPYILRNMGSVYVKLEQYDKAERTLQDALRQEPRNHNGHYRLGWVYERLGKWAEGAQEYRTACDLRQRAYKLPFPDAEQALAKLLSEHPEAHPAAKDAPLPRPAPPPKPAPQPRSDAAPPPATARSVGTVKRFFADKGFGFLEAGPGQPDLFFHISQVKGRQSVQAGERLEYRLGRGKKGLIATDLRVVESS